MKVCQAIKKTFNAYVQCITVKQMSIYYKSLFKDSNRKQF
jgi:hypothetical protein